MTVRKPLVVDGGRVSELVSGDAIETYIGIPPGNAAAPGLYVIGDTNTGIYSPGLDTLAISTAGAERFIIGSGGNVALATANAKLQLLIAGGTERAYIQYLDAPTDKLVIDSDAELALNANNTERVLIDTSGNVAFDTSTLYVDAVNNRVGIGLTNPATPIEISSTSSVAIQHVNAGTQARSYRLANLGADAYFGIESSVAGAFFTSASAYATVVYASSAIELISGSGVAVKGGNFAVDTNTLYVDAVNNRVGIGTASPSVPLHIVTSGGTEVRIQGTTEYLAIAGGDGTGAYFNNSVARPYYWQQAGSIKMELTAAGNLAVDTNTLYVDSVNNRVGIGTAAPDYPLHLSAPSASGVYIATLHSTDTSTASYSVTRLTGAMTAVVGVIGVAGSTAGNPGFRDALSIQTQTAHPLVFGTNDSEKARITSGGSLLVNTASALNTYTEKLAVNGTITAGDTVATLGPVLLQGQYGGGALTTFGSEHSNGGPVIGYGVYPGTAAPATFKSATSVAAERSALTLGGDMRWYTAASQTVAIGSAITLTERMRLTNGGNLLVGTTTDAGYKLDVAGTLGSTGNASLARTGGVLNVGDSVSTADVNLNVGQGRSGSGFAYIDLVGDTTYTDFGLRIIRGNGGANTASELNHRGTGAFQFVAQDAAAMSFFTTGTERARITAGGNVLIGTTSDIGYQLYGTGSAFFDGTVTSNNSGTRSTFSAAGIDRSSASAETFNIQNSGAGAMTLQVDGVAVNSFQTIAVSGQSNVVADAVSDTLTLVAGTGITITTDAGADSITITGGSSLSGVTSTSNTSLGVSAGSAGSDNVNIGHSAGAVLDGTSFDCVMIGDGATSSSAAGQGRIAIGRNASSDQNNRCVVAGSSLVLQTNTNVTFGVKIESGAAAKGVTLTGAAAQTGTDAIGQSANVYPGAGTGNAVGGYTQLYGTNLNASGSSAQSSWCREGIGYMRALTNNSALAVLRVGANAGTGTFAVVVRYAIHVTNGTDVQVEEGVVSAHYTVKAGTVANKATLKSGNQQAVTSGTLTVTFTLEDDFISSINLTVNANSSLTPSTGYPRIIMNADGLADGAGVSLVS